MTPVWLTRTMLLIIDSHKSHIYHLLFFEEMQENNIHVMAILATFSDLFTLVQEKLISIETLTIVYKSSCLFSRILEGLWCLWSLNNYSITSCPSICTFSPLSCPSWDGPASPACTAPYIKTLYLVSCTFLDNKIFN